MHPDFAQVESGHFDKSRPACQCLRDAAHKIERCAPQHEELGRVFRAIGKDSQERKEPGLPLEFIDDHQSPEVLQNLFGNFRFKGALRIFQIKVCPAAGSENIPGKGSFAALPRPQEKRHRVLG